WSAAAGFRIERGGASAWLEQDGLTIDLRRAEPMDAAAAATDGPGAMEPAAYTTARARLSFVGARSTLPAGEDRHPARAHFALGNDPAAWRHDVPMFRSARWSTPWPGIDVRAHAHAEGLLEFDLELSAGVDPRAAVLQWEGIEKVDRQEDGALRIHTAAGELLQSAPVAWQVESDGTKLPVAVTVEMLEGNRFRFRADAARQGLPLVIDPVLCYHGGAGNEAAHGVARDAAGRVVVAGFTNTAPASGFDVLVSCFDFTPPIPLLVWTTTLGGSLDERAFDIDADAAGFFTLAGATSSTNFPVMNALQPAFGGGARDGFVVQLDQSGALTSTTYGTYYGGAGDDWFCRVEMDQQLQATVAGYSDSTNLPAVNAFQPNNAGLRDAFVVRFASFGTSCVYSTYLGGGLHEGFLSNPFTLDSRLLGLDVDAAGRVLLTGYATSANFPVTPNAWQPNLSGGADAFVTILDPNQQPGNQLVYSTYLGGASVDGGMAARFGPRDTVVVGGFTYSPNFPITPGAFQTTFVGPANFNDAFLVYLDVNPLTPPAAQLTYGTFFGGMSTPASIHYDCVVSLAVDGRGHATAVGFCGCNAPWPTHCGAFQPTHGGQRDGFVVRLRPLGTGADDVTFATFLGGALDDHIQDVELEPDGGIALGAGTFSANIPGPLGGLNGPQDMLVGTMEVLPVGVTRGPGSSAYCAGGPSLGTVMLEVDRQPAAGATFAFLVGGGPPGTVGLLGLNFGPPGPGVPLAGALVCVALAPPPVALFVACNPLGAAPPIPLSVPLGWGIPLGIHAQALLLAPAPCALPFTSSATLVL
ncbi:MAG TPA: hypothetical protein VFT55_07695, partial [Planctomycetota bacterium]|nr:hypothetical protein [Planctomycetota bacterium]